MSKKQIVRWVIAVLCILFVPVCGSPISVVLLLGAAITVAPVEAVQAGQALQWAAPSGNIPAQIRADTVRQTP